MRPRGRPEHVRHLGSGARQPPPRPSANGSRCPSQRRGDGSSRKEDRTSTAGRQIGFYDIRRARRQPPRQRDAGRPARHREREFQGRDGDDGKRRSNRTATRCDPRGAALQTPARSPASGTPRGCPKHPRVVVAGGREGEEARAREAANQSDVSPSAVQRVVREHAGGGTDIAGWVVPDARLLAFAPAGHNYARGLGTSASRSRDRAGVCSAAPRGPHGSRRVARVRRRRHRVPGTDALVAGWAPASRCRGGWSTACRR